MGLNKRIVSIIMVGLLSILPTSTISNPPAHGVKDTGFLPSGIDIQQILPDPEMDISPNVHVNGTSSEFSFYHSQTAESEPDNYVGLVWNHTACTELNWYNGSDSELPDCNDFIYFTQEIEWNVEEVPGDAFLNFSFSINTTGDFHEIVEGGLMFKVYVWLIDASGNWDMIHRSFPPYIDSFQQRMQDLDFIEIQNAWCGMVKNSSGIQEDPSDTLTLAIGLSPTENFQSYFDTHPWNEYNGTVTAKITRVNLFSFMETEIASEHILEPIDTTTWRGNTCDIFPDVNERFVNSSDECIGIVTDENSSVYVLAEYKTTNEAYHSADILFEYQTLIKYSPELELQWVVHHRNRTTALDIAFNNGFIYTVGSENINNSWDLLLTKWDCDGAIVWNTSWNTGIDEYGGAVGVGDDGAVYILAERCNSSVSYEPVDTQLLKYDSNGEFEWNETINMSGPSEKMQIEVTSDGIYTYDSSVVSHRNFLGVELWTISANSMTVSNTGSLYTSIDWGGASPHYGRGITFSRYNNTGACQWSTEFAISYYNFWYQELRCVSLSIAPDGSVITFLENTWVSYEYYFVRFSPDGEYEWRKNISAERWNQPWDKPDLLIVAPNGIAYLGATLYDGERDVQIYSYDVGVQFTTVSTNTDSQPAIPTPLEMIMIALIVSGSLFGFVLMVALVQKSRKGREN